MGKDGNKHQCFVDIVELIYFNIGIVNLLDFSSEAIGRRKIVGYVEISSPNPSSSFALLRTFKSGSYHRFDRDGAGNPNSKATTNQQSGPFIEHFWIIDQWNLFDDDVGPQAVLWPSNI